MCAISTIDAEHHEFEVMGEQALDLIRAGSFTQARLFEEDVETMEDELDHELEAFRRQRSGGDDPAVLERRQQRVEDGWEASPMGSSPPTG